MKQAERGIRYGDIGGRDKEESICDKGSDHAGQKDPTSDAGDRNRSAADERIH